MRVLASKCFCPPGFFWKLCRVTQKIVMKALYKTCRCSSAFREQQVCVWTRPHMACGVKHLPWVSSPKMRQWGSFQVFVIALYHQITIKKQNSLFLFNLRLTWPLPLLPSPLLGWKTGFRFRQTTNKFSNHRLIITESPSELGSSRMTLWSLFVCAVNLCTCVGRGRLCPCFSFATWVGVFKKKSGK